jgi:ribonuclease HII
MKVFGVDEAGRGPILGPMAVAVVALEHQAVLTLREFGVADSKSFGVGTQARERRAELAAKIRRHAAATACVLVSVEDIDRYVFRGQLNVLEREVARDLLGSVAASGDDRIICDGSRLFAPLRRYYPALEAIDRAESIYVSVAAASIVAKHARDEAFSMIARRYEPEFGPIAGGGYANAATRRFLSAYEQRYGGLPPETRKSWGAKKQLDLLQS